MRTALVALLERYTGLVNSGDAGSWACEKESCVIYARTVLANFSLTGDEKKELAESILCHLRESFEDDPTDPLKDSSEIEEYFGLLPKEVYDWDTDTGIMQMLLDNGVVHRYGNSKEGFSWSAAGGRVTWGN